MTVPFSESAVLAFLHKQWLGLPTKPCTFSLLPLFGWMVAAWLLLRILAGAYVSRLSAWSSEPRPVRRQVARSMLACVYALSAPLLALAVLRMDPSLESRLKYPSCLADVCLSFSVAFQLAVGHRNVFILLPLMLISLLFETYKFVLMVFVASDLHLVATSVVSFIPPSEQAWTRFGNFIAFFSYVIFKLIPLGNLYYHVLLKQLPEVLEYTSRLSWIFLFGTLLAAAILALKEGLRICRDAGSSLRPVLSRRVWLPSRPLAAAAPALRARQRRKRD